jgi:hypothetical protein
MAHVDAALKASREAVDQIIALAEQTSTTWTTARAPGKWSPSQIVEHVAMTLEESAKVATGQPSKFPRLPAIVRPLVRAVFFNRILKKGAFPKAKTNPAMNPPAGPATPAAGRVRLERAHAEFESVCRRLAAEGARVPHTIFGAIAVEDYVRFLELHTRHHSRQIAG